MLKIVHVMREMMHQYHDNSYYIKYLNSHNTDTTPQWSGVQSTNDFDNVICDSVRQLQL